MGTAAYFGGIGGLLFDPSRNLLLLADIAANIVRSIEPGTGLVSTIIGNVSLSNGRPDASNPSKGNNDGPAAQATFLFPFGLAFLAPGVLAVSDSGNHALRLAIPAPGSTDKSIVTIAGADSIVGGGWTDGPGSTSYFNDPLGLAVSPDGSLVVADAINHAIRRVTCNITFPAPPPSPPAPSDNSPLGPIVFGGLRSGEVALILVGGFAILLAAFGMWYFCGTKASPPPTFPSKGYTSASAFSTPGAPELPSSSPKAYSSLNGGGGEGGVVINPYAAAAAAAGSSAAAPTLPGGVEWKAPVTRGAV